MLRTFLHATAIAVLFTGTAAAQSGNPNPASNDNFGGGYVGLFGGVDTTMEVEVTETGAPYNLAGFDYDGTGFDAGVFGGYNFKSGSFVVGGEAEFGVRRFDFDQQFPAYVGVRQPNDSRSFIETDLFLSGSLRAGTLLNDDVLIYAKGGAFALRGEARYIDNDPTGLTLVSGTSEREMLWGGHIGAGIEYQVVQDFSVRAEALYNMFVNDDITVNATSSVATNPSFKHELDPFVSVRVLLTYWF